jgi:hypothetical protein
MSILYKSESRLPCHVLLPAGLCLRWRLFGGGVLKRYKDTKNLNNIQ